VETVRSGTEWTAVDDASAVGSARRAAVRMAHRLGFDESRVGDVGIVVTELATNLWRHATQAVIGIQVALRQGVPGVRVIASDRGPGMHNVDLSASDGHSTSGTLGVGLGAVIRLSSSLDVSTEPGRGTVVSAELWPTDTDLSPETIDVAGLTRPIKGEDVCGDAIAARVLDGRHLLMVSDGLGHGPMAATASAEAVDAFHAVASVDPATVLRAVHDRITGTRGAAVTVAAFEESFDQVSFAGVGNVSSFVATVAGRRAVLSQPGIVGHQLPKIRTETLPLEPDSVVVMHSDGVRDAWQLGDTPGLSRRRAAVIAATLLRDAATRPDDASVLVARRR
jgi:anti-sigma regulatory factor (Ser/Thr protein kinase)